MTGSTSPQRKISSDRIRFAILSLFGFALLLAAAVPEASAQTRSLKLYFLHTKERAEITYKINGKYSESGLRKINRILRDWRRDEPTKMDPKLLDLLWEVYRRSGSRDYIHVISAYRSPATNSMLRKRSKGVAKNSQHTLGRAMDFFLPDVKLSKLREVGLKLGAGGVGYYPTSGSPFVHMDTGRVRHWPRMSRRELARLFPDGKTLHIPSDGKPMPGYDRAMASYKARRATPAKVQVAKAEPESRPSLFARWLRPRRDRSDDENKPAVAENTTKQDDTTPIQAPTTEDPSRIAELRPPDGSEFTLPESVPVPSRRPLAESRFALATPEDALRAGIDASDAPRARPATLTPGEIEDLRRSAIASDLEPLPGADPAPLRPALVAALDNRLGTSAERDFESQGQSLAYAPEATLRGPRPAAEIPLAATPTPVLRSGIQQSTPAPQQSPSRVLRTRPIPAADLRTTGAIPEPRQRPSFGPSTQTLELALAPANQSSSAGEAIRKLIDAQSHIDSLAAPPEQIGAIQPSVLANNDEDLIPVPAPNQQLALAKWRRVTLDGQAPSHQLALNRGHVGKWGISPRRSLTHIGQLRAPIYGTFGGRNEIAIDGFIKVAATYPTDSLSKR